MLSQSFREVSKEKGSGGGAANSKKQKTADTESFFCRFEEQFYQKAEKFSFTFPCETSSICLQSQPRTSVVIALSSVKCSGVVADITRALE
jgi:hypothetical protein